MQVLGPFFNPVIYLFILLLHCRGSFYILDSNPLLDIWLGKVFSLIP